MDFIMTFSTMDIMYFNHPHSCYSLLYPSRQIIPFSPQKVFYFHLFLKIIINPVSFIRVVATAQMNICL